MRSCSRWSFLHIFIYSFVGWLHFITAFKINRRHNSEEPQSICTSSVFSFHALWKWSFIYCFTLVDFKRICKEMSLKWWLSCLVLNTSFGRDTELKMLQHQWYRSMEDQCLQQFVLCSWFITRYDVRGCDCSQYRR